MESNKFFNRRVLSALVFASFGSASAMAMYDEAKHGVATFIGDGIKTKLIEILADKKEGDWDSPTIGNCSTFSKELPSGQSITVSLCDVASQPRYRSGSSLYLWRSNKTIIVLNGEDTNNILIRFREMKSWLDDTRADRTSPLAAIVFDHDSSSQDSLSDGRLFENALEEETNVWRHDNNRTFPSLFSVNLGTHRGLEELREEIATQVFLSVKDEACSTDRGTLTQVRDSNEKYCNI